MAAGVRVGVVLAHLASVEYVTVAAVIDCGALAIAVPCSTDADAHSVP